ncbi:MAG: M20/M25/M40 family metallo-hydrolase [Fusobacterium sp.]|nr:M20/M25/M40 family metallo-hydrolase [Fusobacterium sp.]
MPLNEIRREYELVDLFCNLAEIPSPSLHEEKVAEFIKNYCAERGIHAESDSYGNVYVNIPATDEGKQPILLSAHMDVIGDDSPVVTYLDGDLIRAEGRTLGGDDKAGVANALYFATQLVKSDMKHGGLELFFTRDEESGMSGIHNADFKKIHSKYILVCDSDSLGQLEISGASYTLATIKIKSAKGGHSGIDIGDTTRHNAAKLVAELVHHLPQGVFYEENGSVITSCNIGGIVAGKPEVTNIINTDALVTYSIRSASRAKEAELKAEMEAEVQRFNDKYATLATAELTFAEHLPPFEASDDKFIPEVFKKAGANLGLDVKVSSFHAGAETHIYANETNFNGEKFSPYLIGLATVCNMHSKEENLDYKTLLKGQELLSEIFKIFNA